jgi:hypothetical protein
MKVNEYCPIVENGGIMISKKILHLRSLNKLQTIILSYIENCIGGYTGDSKHLAFVMQCSERKVNNAMEVLACLELLCHDGEALVINYKSEAWKRL